MGLRLRYFASLRETIGKEAEEWELQAGWTVGDIRQRIIERYPEAAESLSRVVAALNHQYVSLDTPVHEQDELVFIPPLGGGSPEPEEPVYQKEPMMLFTHEPLQRDLLIDYVSHPAVGGIVVFEGVVRNHARGKQVRYLEYEIYEEMAGKELRKVLDEARKQWDVQRIAVAHRSGRLEIGEASVIIVTASPHRAEAFAANRYIIDELKKRVPIWKKEVATNGESWVEG